MNLYPWQEECLKQWFANHGRGMVQAVTGAGKTRLALAASNRLKEQLNSSLQVKIVVPTSSLMHQWKRALQKFLTDNFSSIDSQREIGMRGGGYKSPADRPYMIYVINSARYELARQILSDLKNGDAVLLIADECHHYVNGQNSLIFEFLPYIKEYQSRFFSLGLSATLPVGESQKYLATALGKKIYHYGISQAAATHNVCPYDIFHVEVSFDPSERAEYQELSDRLNVLFRRLLLYAPYLCNMNRKEQFELLRTLAGDKHSAIAETAGLYIKLSYKRSSLVCLASARIKCACNLVKLLPPRERILIFGERIQQAEELYRLLQVHYPGKVGRYHSQLGQQANQNTLQRFRDGEIRILITCKSLDEGLDVPDASIGIILSGTSVQRQRIQRLGRIIRKKEGKSRASLYYLHIADTTEDKCFLPDTSECRIAELKYHTDSQQFVHSRYDRAAFSLLNKLLQTKTEHKISAEFERCILLGRVRLDWLDSYDSINTKIFAATNVEEKNYWICMRSIKDRI